MKKTIENLHNNTKLGRCIFAVPFFLNDFYKYTLLSDKSYIKKRFKKTFGYELNLDDPKNFTEKIQWLMLYDRTPLHTQCADKYAVREYIAEKIGDNHLIPLAYYTREVNDISIEKLPDYPVIIKATHNSGGAVIINNKHTADLPAVKKQLAQQLKQNYYKLGREWEYKNITPGLVVEKLIQDESGNEVLNDYKIHCFNGQPAYIQTIFDRKTEVKEDWYDTNWNLVDAYYFSPLKKHVPKPALLGEMLKIARTLSAAFAYVRVDLYEANRRVYFGELTFHPYSGLMKFNPPEFNRFLGDKLILPKRLVKK